MIKHKIIELKYKIITLRDKSKRRTAPTIELIEVGNYNNSGSNNPASDRNNNNPNNSNSNNSARPALILFQIIYFTEYIQRNIRY